MKTVELTEAIGTIAEYAYAALSEPITFTLGGKPVVFLASAEWTDEEAIALSANAEFLRVIERSRESMRKYGTISADEMRRRVEQWEVEERAAAAKGY